MLFEPHNNKKIIGLNKIKDKVFEDFANGKLHHSSIFIGDKGIGKATLCYHLANKILDYESSLKKNAPVSLFGDVVEGDDLDDNNPTFNLIKNRKHPDLLVIEKEVDAKTSKVDREIKVSSARKISDFMALSPFASKNKVVIIDSIDEMNISAQNAILKVLEEPLKNTYIFLVCHNKNNVLETIHSRCKEINIAKYNIDDWRTILGYAYADKFKALSEEQSGVLYNLSNGSISFAIDIMEQDGLFLYNYIENLLAQDEMNVEDLQNLAEQLNNNDKLYSLFSEFIVLLLYRVLRYFSIGESDEAFRSKNYNFILRNNEKSILDKIAFTQRILKDIKIYNLSKKHAIIVLFNELIK